MGESGNLCRIGRLHWNMKIFVSRAAGGGGSAGGGADQTAFLIKMFP